MENLVDDASSKLWEWCYNTYVFCVLTGCACLVLEIVVMVCIWSYKCVVGGQHPIISQLLGLTGIYCIWVYVMEPNPIEVTCLMISSFSIFIGKVVVLASQLLVIITCVLAIVFGVLSGILYLSGQLRGTLGRTFGVTLGVTQDHLQPKT